MIDEFKEILETSIEEKNVRGFSSQIQHLTSKYGVSERTIYTRFKSVFGMSPREFIHMNIFPTKEELSDIILSSTTTEEVREATGLSNRYFVGIYDKYYGVSTFQKARLHILNQRTSMRGRTREDNRSLIYSQLLGDGSYCSKRHALRIQHGERQAGYLRWKVDMLNKAYPKTSTKVKERLHKQGHKYFDYYTNLGNVDILPEEECVEKLTNLGWLLWWLDDGCYSQNISISCKRSKTVREAAIRELSTYGISAREDGTSIIIAGQESDLVFYKNFIEPYINQIPTCMLYKVEDIVEKVCI